MDVPTSTVRRQNIVLAILAVLAVVMTTLAASSNVGSHAQPVAVVVSTAPSAALDYGRDSDRASRSLPRGRHCPDGEACPIVPPTTAAPSGPNVGMAVSHPSIPPKPLVKKPVVRGSGGNGGGGSVAVPSSCKGYGGNQGIGCALLSSFGFGLGQMRCLVNLWSRESGWSTTARNGSSGAYGIPQSLPGSKMASAGSDWRTNPATQIKWGLGYIKGRYGTPCGAWAHSQATGWY